LSSKGGLGTFFKLGFGYLWWGERTKGRISGGGLNKGTYNTEGEKQVGGRGVVEGTQSEMGGSLATN